MESDLHNEFRESLDESAAEMGEAVVADLPATGAEVRDRLPDDLATLSDSNEDVSLRSVIEASPVGSFLEAAAETTGRSR